MSESEGLLERESRMGRVSRRGPLTEGAGNLSTKSDPSGSRGRKLKGGFPRTLPNGLCSMLSTRKEKKGSLVTSFLHSPVPFALLSRPLNKGHQGMATDSTAEPAGV